MAKRVSNSGRRLVECLSKRQRERTPPAFAHYLVGRIRELYHCTDLAVLWTCKDSCYHDPALAVQCWGVNEDARKYRGPYPIIAHPPCGPWAQYRKRCKQDPLDGRLAMEFIHTYGGVVEQPLGSQLFKRHGCFGWVEVVKQGDFGHPSDKATLLYFVAPWTVGRTVPQLALPF